MLVICHGCGTADPPPDPRWGFARCRWGVADFYAFTPPTLANGIWTA
ncbi:MAG: hypothetical protein ABWU84_12415 [Pyrobaculum sp.]